LAAVITRISVHWINIRSSTDRDFYMLDTLYYDGNCPICAHEISLLTRLKDDSLVLTNIHSSQFNEERCEFAREQLLSVLHLQTAQGTWAKGLDAMVIAWSHTWLGWVVKPLRWIGIRSVADRLYILWAQNRACKLGYSDHRCGSFIR